MKPETRVPPQARPLIPASLPAAAPARDTQLPLSPNRRSDGERLRSSSLDREPDATFSADGLFFFQLIQPVGEDGNHQDLGSSGGIALPIQSEELPTQLIDELVQRLTKDSLAPLNVTLLMPNLGKVQVRASKRDDHWSIELGFSRRDVFKRLRSQERACESALTGAFGLPVELSMLDETQA
jgi:hypothetical protein